MSSGGGGESKSGLKKYVRRKMVLDLNSIPGETSSSMEENTNSNSTRQLRGPSRPTLSQPPPPPPPPPVAPPAQPVPAVVTIDVEEIEDEVVICSPRRFTEAKNKSRRSANNSPAQRGNSEEEITRLSLSYNMGKRARANPTIIDCDHYINLDDCNSQKVMNESAKNPSKPAENLPPPRPEPPTFSCPVCMGPLIEEMSTKCGHIFCKGCIRASIKAQGKCPTCRRKIGVKDTIRVYLPATN